MTDNNVASPDLEKKVAEIWTDILPMAVDSPGATFFELDGQSISAVRIVARVSDELGVELDIGELFEDPDLDGFVHMVTARAQG
jgi:acyl carrier protein